MIKQEVLEMMKKARESEDAITMLNALEQAALTVIYTDDEEIRKEYHILREVAFQSEGE